MARYDHHAGHVDQAHRLRQWAGSLTSPNVTPHSHTHVVAVVSGKGGVGKTFLAVNLSIALVARGHRVALFDLDLGLANADIVLGVEPIHTWSDVLAGRRSVEEVLVEAPGQIAFVPGSSGLAHLANLSEFERHQLLAAMKQIEQRYDIVVFDCGAGISQAVVGFARAADTIVVVSTPEPTAITDAYAMVKAFAQDRARGAQFRDPLGSIGVVVNQADSRREGRETYERLAGVAARFLHVPITDYGYVLRDDHVPAAVRNRCPLILRYPRCSASSCIMASAGRLSSELGEPEERRSLFYRVMNVFL